VPEALKSREFRADFPSESSSVLVRRNSLRGARPAEIARADFAIQPLQVVASTKRRHNPSKSVTTWLKQKKSDNRAEKN